MVVNGKEINILGKARWNGEELLIVGESKTQLDRPHRKKRGKGKLKDVWEQLPEKVAAVKDANSGVKIILLIVIHYAQSSVAWQAEKEGIIVVRSFEW